MSSIATSSVSNESLSTDYGLHRALNSVVVPNEQNPIATIKDRKNAKKLEALRNREYLVAVRVTFSLRRAGKKLLWEQSKRLITRSLAWYCEVGYQIAFDCGVQHDSSSVIREAES